MSATVFLNGRVTLEAGDCLDVLRSYPDCHFDSVCTDPPYALVSIVKRFGKAGAKPTKDGDVYSRASAGFMGKAWDTGERAFAVEFWQEVYRVLKPGGHVIAASGTRTYHRLACAVEDAGFEIRDMVQWLYGSGFPKSHDVSKGIDKAAGAERRVIAKGDPVRRMIPGADQAKAGWEKNNGRVFVPTETAAATAEAAAWEGWGTALKPACEPWVLARKPLTGTVAENVLQHGTGAINIDGCRVGSDTRSRSRSTGELVSANLSMAGGNYAREIVGTVEGRWPANIVHDGSDEVVAAFPSEAGGSGKASGPTLREGNTSVARGKFNGLAPGVETAFHGDTCSAARFFYSAKADATDRIGSKHPTVKPVDLMQWLVRLVTPKGGLVLDPFAGTGTTGEAAWRDGMRAVLIEREDEYRADIARRMRLADRPDERAAVAKAKGVVDPPESLPLFGGDGTNAAGGGGASSTAASRPTNRADRVEEVTR